MMQAPGWIEPDWQRSRERGLTLIEMMVTVGIMVIILAFSIPKYDAWRQSTALQSANETLVAHLKQARLMAVSQNRTVSVVFTSSSYTVDSGGADQQQYPLSRYSNRLTLTPNFPGTPSTLIFYSSGMTNITGANKSVTISNADGVSKTITVNTVGQF